MAYTPPSIVVVGSVNLDIVASAPRLPVAGETVTNAELNRYPGGKGANQALAAKRLGAKVSLFAATGEDAAADEALALLRAENVDLSGCVAVPGAATGVALISVAPSGENQIVVAPGANAKLTPELIELPRADALICQLEVPVTTLVEMARQFRGFFSVNLAPAMSVPDELLRRADLIVMNETEAAHIGTAISDCSGLVALTFGADGALLKGSGSVIAQAKPPAVHPVDTTGAGDTFTAALTLALVEGRSPDDALTFACAAAACATMKHGAQPSFPFRKDVENIL